MDELKKRKTDNGMRKFINPGWLAVILLIATLIASVISIPALTKTVQKNTADIIRIKANYEWIKNGITNIQTDIKELIKDR